MQMIDAKCRTCGVVREDTLLRDTGFIAPCEACGSEHMERVFVANRPTASVAPDSIPGGLYLKHGLCNADGTPRRYDSYSEIRKEAAARGWTNVVEHVTTPESGSDKNPHTQRFIGLPASLNPEDEAARIRNWHAHEAQLNGGE